MSKYVKVCRLGLGVPSLSESPLRCIGRWDVHRPNITGFVLCFSFGKSNSRKFVDYKLFLGVVYGLSSSFDNGVWMWAAI